MADTNWLGTSEQHLVACQGRHQLREEVCTAFREMQQAAQTDGVDLQIVSSFRDFHRQQQIWDAKWLGHKPLYNRCGELIDTALLTDDEKLYAILIWSALPGASRHHWGTDLDVYDKTSVGNWPHTFELVASEYGESGPCYNLHCWLNENAEKHGFYRPYAIDTGGVAPEPWHLSFSPTASKIIEQLDLNVLRGTLLNSTVQGKTAILENLEDIFQRFTLNGEKP